jgi:hypothetical protein
VSCFFGDATSHIFQLKKLHVWVPFPECPDSGTAPLVDLLPLLSLQIIVPGMSICFHGYSSDSGEIRYRHADREYEELNRLFRNRHVHWLKAITTGKLASILGFLEGPHCFEMHLALDSTQATVDQLYYFRTDEDPRYEVSDYVMKDFGFNEGQRIEGGWIETVVGIADDWDERFPRDVARLLRSK